MPAHDSPDAAFLQVITERFRSIKEYTEGGLAQIRDDELAWTPNEVCNSVAVLIQHLRGNMWSRWTDPLTTDGEKPDRDRDAEFVVKEPVDRAELNRLWEDGWAILFAALDRFTEEDLQKDVMIRGNKLPLLDALLRQYFHCAFHAGQIVYMAKELRGADWKALSIPRGESASHRGLPK